jgi:DNA-binding GntR family transcriptional regulator
MDYLGRRHHRARLVRDVLRSDIIVGAWADRLLPSEDELARQFDVGRNVIRASLNMLVQENLLRRVPGRGTQATSHIVVHQLNTLRAIAEGDEAGATLPVYEQLHWGPVSATPSVAQRLEVPSGSEILLWERLTRGEVPMVLWSSFIRSDLGLSAPDPASPALREGTFAFFESFGLDVGRAVVHTGAAPADEAVAELLDVAPGATLLVHVRQTLLRDGTPVEVATGYHRPDQMVFVNSFERVRPNVP